MTEKPWTHEELRASTIAKTDDELRQIMRYTTLNTEYNTWIYVYARNEMRLRMAAKGQRMIP